MKTQTVLSILGLAFCIGVFVYSAASNWRVDLGKSVARTSKNVIPPMIHQSWKTRSIPKGYRKWSSSWTHFNPGYTYKLWSDQDNENLIATYYPWFLPTFQSYEKGIMKADASRVFYMHQYGGIYADFDVVALRPIDPLLESHPLVLARMYVPPVDEAVPVTSFFWWNQVPNAWMASKPGHPFWMHCAKVMMQLAAENVEGVEQKTGPMMLYRALLEYQAMLQNETLVKQEGLEPIFIAEENAIFPYSWVWGSPNPLDEKEHRLCSSQVKTFNEAKCRKLVDPDKTSYAISYWSHSWDK